jgi:processive 1,2-diacylglycerol beta-glucosyltransferase
MKVLIFSVSAGGGHNHAAAAVEKHILLNDPYSEVKIIDTIKHINPILDKVVIGSYLKSLKFNPSIFGKLYNFAETGESLANVSNLINEMIIFRLIPLIDEFKPDIVVATHAFSSEMVSILKLKGKINVPTLTILTDYAPHSFWLHNGIDAYITSNCDMVIDMISRGIKPNIIHNLGIPVNPDFMRRFDKDETLNGLNLNPNKTTILLMGGSLGMGGIYSVYSELQNIKNDIQIIVITGKNKKLFSQLIDIQNESKKETRIIGYTEEVNKYMQIADLLITKPGGLTITEALIYNLPMAIFSVIPGQEEKNAEFLIKHNLAVSLGDGKQCGGIIENLICDSDKLREMKNNCVTFAKPNSGSDIYKLLLEFTSKNK